MRALTLTQPWCGLMAAGVKPIENRGRKIIAPARAGERFALHASREIDDDVYDRIAEIAPELTDSGIIWRDHAKHGSPRWMKLAEITSAVIGVTRLVTCIERTHEDDGGWRFVDGWPRAPRLLEYGELRWFFGEYGYVCTDMVPLATPVPCRGWQGFWTLPDDVEAAVRRQL